MDLKTLSYKKYSILFWIIYWFVQSLLMSRGEGLDFYLIKNIVIVSLQIFVVYANYKWLMPRFFERKNYVAYVVFSAVLIYLVFTASFVILDVVFDLYYANYIVQKDVMVSSDFWIILTGSSFYSLALVSSTVYRLLQSNQEKEAANKILIERLNGNNVASVIIKEGHKTHKILIEDIYFVKGLKEYVVWHLKDKNIITLQTMSGIELDYKDKGFLRVHKSYIVNMVHVNSFNSNSLEIGDHSIPIGRTFKKRVTEFINREL